MPQAQGEPAQYAYYPTPGLRLLCALPKGPVRGIFQPTQNNDAPNVLGYYAVGGDSVYWISPDYSTINELGTITAGRPYPVSMQDNGSTLVIVDGTVNNGWQVDLYTNVMTPISDPAFYGADKVAYLDTYLIFNSPDTPQFYISDSNAVTFDPLYFADKQSFSDVLVSIAVAKREIWLLGDRTTEIWYNAGASDFPFQEMPSAFIDQGCAAKYSVATYDNQVYWVSRDRAGEGIIVSGGGYYARRISTFAIEFVIAQYATIGDAIGFCYVNAGHAFYVVSFPAGDQTFVYDITTQQWHEWCYLDVNGREHRHLANCCYAAPGGPVFGDRINGNIYATDTWEYTDNGMPIKRQRSFPHLISDFNRIYYRQFKADIDTGQAPQTTIAIDMGETVAGGYQALPRGDSRNGEANATSADGSITVGWVSPAGVDTDSVACYWVGLTGPFPLFPLGADTYNSSYANGVSADGSVIVGTVLWPASGPGFPGNAYRPFVWTAATGVVAFAGEGGANGISADGTTIVGYQTDLAGDLAQATWWDRATLTLNDLGYLPGHNSSVAVACCADGSVIVGWSGPGGYIANHTGNKAFRWTAAAGMTDLGFLPSPDFPGDEVFGATGVSADGSIVAGWQYSNVNPGFVWSATRGMVSIPAGESRLLDVLQTARRVALSTGNERTRDRLNALLAGMTSLPVGASGSTQAVSADGTTFITAPGVAMGYDKGGTVTIPAVVPLDPTLPGVIQVTEALGLNSDGSVIVGCADPDFAGTPPPGVDSTMLSRIPFRYTIPHLGGVTFQSTGAQIFLDWSDDRGHRWGNALGQALGNVGAYLTSLQWQRLGMARDRVFRLTWSAPCETSLQGAWIEVDNSAKS